MDFVDWDGWLLEKKGKVVPSGLYTLDRKPRPVCREFKKIIREYSHLPILKENPLFGIGDGLAAAPPANSHR